MIYKFIDSNGAEITVNSLSSLEALVESETVKENTKVKAGLRGKWTAANNIEELKDIFNKKMEVVEEPDPPQEDIKSFITKEEPIEQEVIPEPIKQEVIVEKIQPIIKNEKVPANTFENEHINKENLKNDKEITDSYDDRFESLNFFFVIKNCYKKYFDFNGRASRTEFWYFWIFGWFTTVFLTTLFFYVSKNLIWILVIFIVATTIPWVALTARRLHDLNKSGWYQLVPVIVGVLTRIPVPMIGILFSILQTIIAIYLWILYASRGTDGRNKYGEYPLKFKK